MTERPNVHAEVLLSAGRRYGDAILEAERAVREWSPGQPRDKFEDASQRADDAEHQLLSAARAYATRMRRKTAKAAAQT